MLTVAEAGSGSELRGCDMMPRLGAHGTRPEETAELLKRILPNLEGELRLDSVIVITDDRVRNRPLPI